MHRCLAISSHQVCLKHAMEMFKYGPWAENGNHMVVKGAFGLLRLTHHPSKHIKFQHPHIQQSTVGGILVRCKTCLQVPDSRVQAWSQQSCLRRDKIQYFGESTSKLAINIS